MSQPWYKREYSSVKVFFVSGAFWMCIGTSLGFFSALHLVAPDVLTGISWLEFGRVRAAHTNTVLFGFVVVTLMGAALYILPKVLNTRLFSEPMANLSGLFFNLAVLLGALSLMGGKSQGREYAEYIYPVDALVVIAFALLIVNLFMTIVRRREPLLYVSAWYFLGAVLWTGTLYPVGNAMWRFSGTESGITDAILLWFYGHNIFGLLVTPLAVGIGYYMVPRIARAPLYSQVLSIIGFWTLLLFYTHIGGHHLLQAPIPTWLKTVSIIDSFSMMLPVATVLVNWWYTARGRWSNFMALPAGKLLMVGSIWYAIVCLQGPIQSLAWVQRVTHFNNWVVAHAHIAVLGFTGFVALAGMYYVLPYVTGRKLFSERLVNVQYWLVLLGLIGFFIFLTAGGIVQGHVWLHGGTVYRSVPMLKPWMVLRAMSGVLVIAGAYIGLYNVILSLYRGQRIEP